MDLECIKNEYLRIEEDAIHSSKGHYNASNFFNKIHYIIGIPTAICSAWAGIDVFSNNAILAGYLAFFVATLAVLQTFINARDQAINHKKSGDEFNSLKNKARFLRTIKTNKLTEKKIIEQIELLSSRLNELNRISLQIPKHAFDKAKKGINNGQADYLVDKEQAI